VTGSALTPGIIAAIQTFGDMINFHPHFHFLVTEGGAEAAGVFHEIPKCGGTMKVVASIMELAAVDRIIDHLKLTFVAEKPPPSRVFEQVPLMAAEESGEYFQDLMIKREAGVYRLLVATEGFFVPIGSFGTVFPIIDIAARPAIYSRHVEAARFIFRGGNSTRPEKANSYISRFSGTRTTLRPAEPRPQALQKRGIPAGFPGNKRMEYRRDKNVAQVRIRQDWPGEKAVPPR